MKMLKVVFLQCLPETLRSIKIRCSCCNRNLSDYESTLRSANTGDYLDTCVKCLRDLDIPTLKNNNPHIVPDETPDEFFEEDEE